MKPITKPFPDGPSDDALCEAIHSQETNLWERFGHFIPLYKPGVIWVGDGDDKDRKATEAAIATYAPRVFYADGRACSKGGVLFYADDLEDGYTDALQRKYYIQELEDTALKANPIVKKTMAQRFVVQKKAGVLMFRQICRSDPALCESVERLHNPDAPCDGVVSSAEEEFHRTDRAWADKPDLKFNERALSAACKRLAPSDRVCLVLWNTEAERKACWRELAPKLGL